MSILTLDDVRVWYGGVKAVDGVSITLEKGRLHALVGPNGSGKTTLVNTMSRLAPLTAGRVAFNGEDTSTWSPHSVYRKGLARTFQGIRLIDELTVRQNVMLGVDQKPPVGYRPTRARTARIAQATDMALERLEIAHTATMYPGSLPYGIQRRVEIARALAGDPSLLLLDEPVAGMSTSERHDIASVLSKLRDEGVTMLLIEHDLQFVLGLSDHMFVLNFGTLLASGEPKETAALPAVQEAFLGRKHVSA